MLIGEKKDFAVEYSFSNDYPKNMGYGRIWIRNKFIGTYEDMIFLNAYLLGTLYELKEAEYLSDDLKQLTTQQLFDEFYNNDYRYRQYMVGGSTFTDDFSIWVYKLADQTCLLWKLMQSSIFDDLKNYGQEVFSDNVSTDRLNEVISKLESEFRSRGIAKV